MRKFSLSPLARPNIERIWIAAAAQIGLRVERTAAAYASSDGAGGIFIANDEHLDRDDAVAQLIFHEICHALCEGPERATLPDWGLDNTGAAPEHVVHEHACLRLQIHLAAPYALRELMAPTTEYRAYHDRVPIEPLADDGDPAVPLARAAAARAAASPWREAIASAMSLTTGALAHPLGFRLGAADKSCASCAWRYSGGRGKPVTRCRQSADRDGVGRRIDDDTPSCDRWEPAVDCRDCGACCREAYHSVTVSVRDPVVWRQPALIARHGHRFEIRREGERCAALLVVAQAMRQPDADGDVRADVDAKDQPRARSFSCSIYEDRPQACRDFEAGGGIAWTRDGASASAGRERLMEVVDIFLPLDESGVSDDGDGSQGAAAPPPSLSSRVEQALGWPRGTAGEMRVVRRSLDARKKHSIGYRLRVEVARKGETLARADGASVAPTAPATRWPAGRPPPRVVVIGSGPAGTWAALRLAEAGVLSRIVELGKPVQPRRRDLALLNRGTLNPSSNYCFGEGGAGTYSDGKLYTRAKDRAAVAQVLADLVRFGAPPDIEVESRPHVGSNRLPKVLDALRAHLEDRGVVYHFATEVTGVRADRDQLRAVRLAGGGELEADVAVLAVGHSARSVYGWAAAAGIALERKGIAVGVRLEHPQPVIDEIQYGRAAGHPQLPPAFYELRGMARERGVYSFCMCPGGWIVPAATEAEGVVVNGMSLSRRDSPFANSGFVVTVEPADFGPDAAGPLAGVEFQRAIERAAFRAGGGAQRAPAQRLVDFLDHRASASLPPASYRPGIAAVDLGAVFPPFVLEALRDGLRGIAGRVPGFLHADAQLIAAETRTSAPVRILRDAESLESPSLRGLYPAGEGAGYAGGIVSAAIDGARIAARIIASRG